MWNLVEYWKKMSKLCNLIKIVKFGQNFEIWLKLWNSAKIAIFSQNCEIWSKLFISRTIALGVEGYWWLHGLWKQRISLVSAPNRSSSVYPGLLHTKVTAADTFSNFSDWPTRVKITYYCGILSQPMHITECTLYNCTVKQASSTEVQ